MDDKDETVPVETLYDLVEAFNQRPSSPRNWSWRRKWASVLVLAAMTFVVSLTPSIFAPAIEETMEEFGSSNTKLETFVISVYVLGWASGPLIVSPLSELYGRLWVYHISNVLFVIFVVACALSRTLAMLVAFRFLAGAVGSAQLNLGGGTVADLFVQEERGAAMTVWTIGALMGPILGPIMGGFLARAYGWRWTFWLVSILATVTALLFVAVMRETYAPTLLNREGYAAIPGDQSPRSKFWIALRRPLSMLLFSPIILATSLYIALVFGYQYLLITTIPTTFKDVYGFSTGSIGLVYLGLGVGMLVMVILFGFCSDRLLVYQTNKSKNKIMKPEFRLVTSLPGAILVPMGIFLYGWSAQYRLHWIVPIIGTAFLGAGLNSILMSLQTYLIDAYTLFAASALAANTIIRSMMGALLPLAGPDMFRSVGLGWGGSILGFVALLFLPVPLLLMRYGERLRVGSRFDEKSGSV